MISTMAVLMLCSLFGILSVSGCFASVVESTDMWMAMNKRLEFVEKKLAQVEILEKKLEQYSLKNDELVLENQALRQRVHDIEATNSEMTTEIKILTTIINDCQKNYQIILNDVENIKKENFMKFASNTTSDLAISKNDTHVQGHEIKYRKSADRIHKRIGELKTTIKFLLSSPFTLGKNELFLHDIFKESRFKVRNVLICRVFFSPPYARTN